MENQMKIYVEKSQVISSSHEGVWPVLNLDFEQKYTLKIVELFKYLGLTISPKMRLPSKSKGKKMEEKA